MGGNETDGDMGAAGPGPAEGAETDSDYGGGMGISMSNIGSLSGGAGAASFGLEGLLGLSNPDLGFSTNFSDFSDFSDYGDYGMPADLSQVMDEFDSNPLGNFLDGLPKGLKGLLGVLDKSGVLGNVFGLLSMATNPDKGQAFFGKGGAMIGGMMAGLPGAMIGGALGSHAGKGAFSGLSSPGGGAEAGGVTSGMDMSSILSGLGGLYSGYKGMKQSGDMLGGLQGLYSQNSPYAQQLRQQLARQDAAGGRRSQYGPREVELQARLAQMASDQIPAMSQLAQQRQIAHAAMLKGGLGLFDALGGVKGLQGLFGMGGQGGLYDTAATDLINGGSLDSIFKLNGIDQGFNPNEVDWGFNTDSTDWGS